MKVLVVHHDNLLLKIWCINQFIRFNKQSYTNEFQNHFPCAFSKIHILLLQDSKNAVAMSGLSPCATRSRVSCVSSARSWWGSVTTCRRRSTILMSLERINHWPILVHFIQINWSKYDLDGWGMLGHHALFNYRMGRIFKMHMSQILMLRSPICRSWSRLGTSLNPISRIFWPDPIWSEPNGSPKELTRFRTFGGCACLGLQMLEGKTPFTNYNLGPCK